MTGSHHGAALDASPEDMARRLAALEASVSLSERTAGMGSFRFTGRNELPAWSPGLYRILGLDPTKPPTPYALLDQAHPDDRDMLNTAMDSVLRSPGPFYIRYRLMRADGTERHVEISGDVELNLDGEVIAVVGTVVDISRRVETEEQLRSAMDAFRVLTEEANDMICRHDPQMVIQYCSPAITRMLGYDPSDVIGSTFTHLIQPDDFPEVQKAHEDLLVPGAARTVTTRMRHRDGHEVWIEVVCRSSGDPATGRVHEIITVSRDVTARKKAESEVNKARETAESANRTKSRFLATMSHELRTPLNAIIGFSDMIRSELFGALPPRYREYSELIHESGTLLLDLINDILDMSKIEAGRFELSMEDFEAGDVVRSCARLLKAKADQCGLDMIVNISPGTRLDADKRAVKQILLNLVSNAIKFTPRGGQVSLAARESGHQVAIVVSDTGVGIPASELPRLGRPFEQATQDPTLAKAGTGLGLALVRSLAQLHGGELIIESQEGRGTTVTVLLPKHAIAVAA